MRCHRQLRFATKHSKGTKTSVGQWPSVLRAAFQTAARTKILAVACLEHRGISQPDRLGRDCSFLGMKQISCHDESCCGSGDAGMQAGIQADRASLARWLANRFEYMLRQLSIVNQFPVAEKERSVKSKKRKTKNTWRIKSSLSSSWENPRTLRMKLGPSDDHTFVQDKEGQRQR